MTYSLKIRPYQRTDRHRLWRLLMNASEQWPSSARRLDDQIAAVRDRGGRTWLLYHQDILAGYALVDPLPGLEGVCELGGCIAPKHRRQGFASYLLTHLAAELSDSTLRLITHPVETLDSIAAHFLLKQGWFIEHEEINWQFDEMEDLAVGELPSDYKVETLPLPVSANTFRRLYERSFGGFAWFQPYLDDKEVIQELESAEDIIFLVHDEKPVGFAWVRWQDLLEAEIEPVGLIPDYQHRGLGQPFLEQVLRQAREQGARTIKIGAWKDNFAAISLYRKIGFQLESTKTYLGYQIIGKPDIS